MAKRERPRIVWSCEDAHGNTMSLTVDGEVSTELIDTIESWIIWRRAMREKQQQTEPEAVN